MNSLDKLKGQIKGLPSLKPINWIALRAVRLIVFSLYTVLCCGKRGINSLCWVVPSKLEKLILTHFVGLEGKSIIGFFGNVWFFQCFGVCKWSQMLGFSRINFYLSNFCWIELSSYLESYLWCCMGLEISSFLIMVSCLRLGGACLIPSVVLFLFIH